MSVSDTPINDSLFGGGRDDQRVEYKYMIYAVAGNFDWEHRHSFEKWLAKNGQAVSSGQPLAEVMSSMPSGNMVHLIRAPMAGTFFNSPLAAGSTIGPRTSIGHIRTVPADPPPTPLELAFMRPAASDDAVREWDLVSTPPPSGAIPSPILVAKKSARDRVSTTHSEHEYPVREPPQEIRAAMATPTTDSHGVFISYRRSDQAAFAGRLYDHLVNAFDKSTIFMDVDSIDLGLDFVDVLHDALAKCRVVIVVIGREWLSAADEDGMLRLDNPDDFVRLEVEVALQRGLRVIPVLVDGAPMPRSTGLPESLAKLARRNGREISNARFGSDIIELINTLRRILEG